MSVGIHMFSPVQGNLFYVQFTHYQAHACIKKFEMLAIHTHLKTTAWVTVSLLYFIWHRLAFFSSVSKIAKVFVKIMASSVCQAHIAHVLQVNNNNILDNFHLMATNEPFARTQVMVLLWCMYRVPLKNDVSLLVRAYLA